VRTAICDLLGIELPILAFSHCRDVVAEVSRAGGFGVLGASSHTPDELENELRWIDERVGDKPYGVDIVAPMGLDLSDVPSDLDGLVPESHRAFVSGLLEQHGIDNGERHNPLRGAVENLREEVGRELVEVALRHPVRLIANALGPPPPYLIAAARKRGIAVAALVGSAPQATRQLAAGVDVLVAQGSEAGGHCGEVSTMVLVPEVVRIAGDTPVLAAGGIVTGSQVAAALAMGAAGVWTGSVWLTTHEAETAPHTVQKLLQASSRDTVRSRSRTGKPSRQLRSSWTDAWEGPSAPAPLPMPLQSLVSEPALRRVDALAASGHVGAQELATYWVGQGVGLMDRVRSVRDVVQELAEDMLAASDRLHSAVEG
jgi:NAD(P)H-dependent flavin oxidoreductase YrpB (nitropropane dioxygenase family)